MFSSDRRAVRSWSRAAAMFSGLAWGGLALTMPGVAKAQTAPPVAADLESARELMKQGRDLRSSGDHAAALEKFKAAHALAHTPITGLELARSYAQLAMPVEAREICLEIARMPLSAQETERSAAARVDAATLAEEQRGKAAALIVRVSVKPRSVSVRPTVTIDGQAVPFEALAQPRRVNPGEHKISARVTGGGVAEKTVQLASGESQDITIELTVDPTKVDAPGPDKITRGDVPGSTTRLSPLVPIGASVLVVGGIVGTIAGVRALNLDSDLNAKCPLKVCAQGYDYETYASNARASATVSTLGFAFAAVGGVVAVIGLLNPSRTTDAPKSLQSTDTSVKVEPSLSGVVVHGRF